ncbi:DUF4913 domain-containing protein [Streptomyces sp. NPDC088360]|uniref:DUF4913 domain-containing protein n=1 Tax=Streptomyces sp. NPDC088360 TaxID=3154515 RepID=UPI00344BC156
MPADPPAEDDDLPVPRLMWEDIEDLKADVRRLKANASPGPGESPGPVEPGAADGVLESGDEGDQEDEEPQYPPFILLLDPPAYDDEKRALIEWVEGVLVPGYLSEPSAEARWCHLWFEHEKGVIPRLHALWLAWQELTDPATCGYTGPSVWHRDHYDPCMRELRASHGPFQGCTKGEHQIAHRMPGTVPSAWSLGST